MSLQALGPAPDSIIGAGRIRFGRYVGVAGSVEWAGAGRGRAWRLLHWKRWHYVSVLGDDVVLAVAIADVGMVMNGFAYVFDPRARQLLADVSVLGLPRLSGGVAERPHADARSSFAGAGTRLEIVGRSGGWRVTVDGPAVRMQVDLDGHAAATLCAVAPVPRGVANCTHKTHGLLARGRAEAGGRTFVLDGTTATMDHTSGLLARDTSWRWASAAGPQLALNLVEGFQEPLENAVWQGGMIRPLGPVAFGHDPADPMAPWRISSTDGSVSLRFDPDGLRSQDKNLGFAVSRWVQPIGTYSGVIGGTEVDGLRGVIEDHVARW